MYCSRSVRIKLVLTHAEGTCIERHFADTPYTQLVQHAKAMAGRVGALAGEPRFRFVDEDGDEVHMTSEEGRQHAIDFFKPSASSRYLKLSVAFAPPMSTALAELDDE